MHERTSGADLEPRAVSEGLLKMHRLGMIRPASPPAPVSCPATLEGRRSAYLVGVGGVGMSAAAALLRARGLEVAGSDRDPGPRRRRLEALGVRVDGPQGAVELPPDVDLVVASAAVPPDHPQLREARRRGLEVWKYARLLGALMEGRRAICVGGTHGKTTTSALVAHGLLHAGRDPSFVVGGDLAVLGGGARSGAGGDFVAESCEFDRSFHHHRPWTAVVTHVDEDHLDYYRDLAEIQEAFRVFARLVPSDGWLVVHEAFASLFRGHEGIVARIRTYGFGEGADWRAGTPRLDGPGRRSSFTVSAHGRVLGRLEIGLLGDHNALNATAAAATLEAAGLSFAQIGAAMEAFEGVGRRLELVADRGGALVFDDYAHHPVEIRAVVRTIRERYEGRRLIVIFQPHQASRTRRLLDAFAEALAEADEVWIPPIYFARDTEEEKRRITSEGLAARVRAAGGHAATCMDLRATVEHAARRVRPGDVVVTMGAGNVDEVARGLALRLR